MTVYSEELGCRSEIMADVAEPLPLPTDGNTEISLEESAVCLGDGTTCAECGKHFSHPFYFSTHISTHTSEKTFTVVGQCAMCGLVFSDPDIFTQHLSSSEEKLAEQLSSKEEEDHQMSGIDSPDLEAKGLNIEEPNLDISEQVKHLSQDEQSELKKGSKFLSSSKGPSESLPVVSKAPSTNRTSSSRRKRKAPEKYTPCEEPVGTKTSSVPEADSEVEAYLQSLSALGYTVDPAAFASPPSKKQAKKLSGSGRGRGKGQSFFVLPAFEGDEELAEVSEPVPKKPSPKYEYIDDPEDFLEDELEVLPRSGKLTRAQRLEQRLERLSHDSGEKKAIRHVYVSEDSPPRNSSSRKGKNASRSNKSVSPARHPMIRPGTVSGKIPGVSLEVDVAHTGKEFSPYSKQFRQSSSVSSKFVPRKQGSGHPSSSMFAMRNKVNIMPNYHAQRLQRGRGLGPPGTTMRGSKFPIFPPVSSSHCSKMIGNLEKTKQSSREYVEKMLMTAQMASFDPSPSERRKYSPLAGQRGRGMQGILSNSGLFLGRSTSNMAFRGLGSHSRGMGSSIQNYNQRGRGNVASLSAGRHPSPQSFQNLKAGRGSNIQHHVNSRGRGMAIGSNYHRSSAAHTFPYRNGQQPRGSERESMRGGHRSSALQHPYPLGIPSVRAGPSRPMARGAPPPKKQPKLSLNTDEVIVIDDEDEIQIVGKESNSQSGKTAPVRRSRKNENPARSVAIHDIDSDSAKPKIERIETKGNSLSKPSSSKRKSIALISERLKRRIGAQSGSEDHKSDTEQSNGEAGDDHGSDGSNKIQEEDFLEGEDIDGWKVCIAEDSDSGDYDEDTEGVQAKSKKEDKNKGNPPSSPKSQSAKRQRYNSPDKESSLESDSPPSSPKDQIRKGQREDSGDKEIESEGDSQSSIQKKQISRQRDHSSDKETKSNKGDPALSPKEESESSRDRETTSNEDSAPSSPKKVITKKGKEHSPDEETTTEKVKSKECTPPPAEPSAAPDIPAPVSPSSKGNSDDVESQENLTPKNSKADDDSSHTNVSPVSSDLDKSNQAVTDTEKFKVTVDFSAEFSNDLFSNLVNEELDTIGEEASRSFNTNSNTLQEGSEEKDSEDAGSDQEPDSKFPEVVSENPQEKELSSSCPLEESQSIPNAQTSEDLASEKVGTPNTTSTNSECPGSNDDIVDIFTEIEKACKEIEENSNEREDYGADVEDSKETDFLEGDGTEKKTESSILLKEGLEKAMADGNRLVKAESRMENESGDCKGQQSFDHDLENYGKSDKQECVKINDSTEESGIVDDSEMDENFAESEELNKDAERYGEAAKSSEELGVKSGSEDQSTKYLLSESDKKETEIGIVEGENSQTGSTGQIERKQDNVENTTKFANDVEKQAGGKSDESNVSEVNSSKVSSSSDKVEEIVDTADKDLLGNENDGNGNDDSGGGTENSKTQREMQREGKGLNLGRDAEVCADDEIGSELLPGDGPVRDIAEITNVEREEKMDERVFAMNEDKKSEEENASEDGETAVHQRMLKSAMVDKEGAFCSSEGKSEEGVGDTSEETVEEMKKDSSGDMDTAPEEMVSSDPGVAGDSSVGAENKGIDSISAVDDTVKLAEEASKEEMNEKIVDSAIGDTSHGGCEPVTKKTNDTGDTGLVSEEHKENTESATDQEKAYLKIPENPARITADDLGMAESDVDKNSDLVPSDAGNSRDESGRPTDARNEGDSPKKTEASNGKAEEKREEEKKLKKASTCKDDNSVRSRQGNDEDDDDRDNGGSGNSGGNGTQSPSSGSHPSITTNGKGDSCPITKSNSNSNQECVDDDGFKFKPESICNFTALDSNFSAVLSKALADACGSNVSLVGVTKQTLKANTAAGFGKKCVLYNDRKFQCLKSLNKEPVIKCLRKLRKIHDKTSVVCNNGENFPLSKSIMKKKRRNSPSEFPRLKLKLENRRGRNRCEDDNSAGGELKLDSLKLKDKGKFLCGGNSLHEELKLLSFHSCERVGCCAREIIPFSVNRKETKSYSCMKNPLILIAPQSNTWLSARHDYSKKERHLTFAKKPFSGVVVDPDSYEELGKNLKLPPEKKDHSFTASVSTLKSLMSMKKNFPVCFNSECRPFKKMLEQSLLNNSGKLMNRVYSSKWVKRAHKVDRKFPRHLIRKTPSLRKVWLNCKPVNRQPSAEREFLTSELKWNHFRSWNDCLAKIVAWQMELGTKNDKGIGTHRWCVSYKGGEKSGKNQNKEDTSPKDDQESRGGKINQNCKKNSVQIPGRHGSVGGGDEDDNGSDDNKKRSKDVDSDDADEGDDDESDEIDDESDEEVDANLSLNCPLCGFFLNSSKEARLHLLAHQTERSLSKLKGKSKWGKFSYARNATGKKKVDIIPTDTSVIKIVKPSDVSGTSITSWSLLHRSLEGKQVPSEPKKVVPPTKPCVGPIVVYPTKPVVRGLDGSIQNWLAKYKNPEMPYDLKDNSKNLSRSEIDCHEFQRHQRSSGQRYELRSDSHCVDLDEDVEIIEDEENEAAHLSSDQTLDKKKLLEENILHHEGITEPSEPMLKVTDCSSEDILSEDLLAKGRIGSFSGSIRKKKNRLHPEEKQPQATSAGNTKALYYESVAFKLAECGTKEVFVVSPLNNSLPVSSQIQHKLKNNLHGGKKLASRRIDLHRIRSLAFKKSYTARRVQDKGGSKASVEIDVDESYCEEDTKQLANFHNASVPGTKSESAIAQPTHQELGFFERFAVNPGDNSVPDFSPAQDKPLNNIYSAEDMASNDTRCRPNLSFSNTDAAQGVEIDAGEDDQEKSKLEQPANLRNERLSGSDDESSNNSSILDLPVTFLSENIQNRDDSCNVEDMDTEREVSQKEELSSDEIRERRTPAVKSATCNVNECTSHPFNVIPAPKRVMPCSASNLHCVVQKPSSSLPMLSTAIPSSKPSIISSSENVGCAGRPTSCQASKINCEHEISGSNKQSSLKEPSAAEFIPSSNPSLGEVSISSPSLLISGIKSIIPEQSTSEWASSGKCGIKRVKLDSGTIHTSDGIRQEDEIPFIKGEPFDPDSGSIGPLVCDEAIEENISCMDHSQQNGHNIPLIKTEISDPSYDNVHLLNETCDLRSSSTESSLLSLPSLLPSSNLSTSTSSLQSSMWIGPSLISTNIDKPSTNPYITKMILRKRKLESSPPESLQYKDNTFGMPENPNNSIANPGHADTVSGQVKNEEHRPKISCVYSTVSTCPDMSWMKRDEESKRQKLVYVYPSKPVVNLRVREKDNSYWKKFLALEKKANLFGGLNLTGEQIRQAKRTAYRQWRINTETPEEEFIRRAKDIERRRDKKAKDKQKALLLAAEAENEQKELAKKAREQNQVRRTKHSRKANLTVREGAEDME